MMPMAVGGGWEWSIGVYAGSSPLDLQPLRRTSVLSRRDVNDRDAAFAADPFMIQSDGRWWMFFEVAVRHQDRAEIALASSADARRWSYERVVLTEPFHLSYPQIFAWDGAYYMIPETFEAKAVRLYRAEPFPWRWSCIATLLEGEVLLDSTVFRHGGRWWMFTETNPQHRYDTLRLFHSDRLEGGWQEHTSSPVVRGDRRIARPAGSVVNWQGCPMRFAQDCEPEYGLRVRAFAIDELTPRSYRERNLGVVLDAGRLGWNRAGMHHIDAKPDGAGGWIACVDGRH
jgi:hypothetical protein